MKTTGASSVAVSTNPFREISCDRRRVVPRRRLPLSAVCFCDGWNVSNLLIDSSRVGFNHARTLRQTAYSSEVKPTKSTELKEQHFTGGCPRWLARSQFIPASIPV